MKQANTARKAAKGPADRSPSANAKRAPSRAARQDNRRETVLDAAAEAFRLRGYHAVTMRDIAAAAGMIAGSLYYHFASKEALFLAVYAEGVRRIGERVDEAVAGIDQPWPRLAAACRAHAGMLLDESDYAQVILRVLPDDVPDARDTLVAMRDEYEDRFRRLVEALPLADGEDRRAIRLTLLGALNWAKTWYRPGGLPPSQIADAVLGLVHRSLATPIPPGGRNVPDDATAK